METLYPPDSTKILFKEMYAFASPNRLNVLTGQLSNESYIDIRCKLLRYRYCATYCSHSIKDIHCGNFCGGSIRFIICFVSFFILLFV